MLQRLIVQRILRLGGLLQKIVLGKALKSLMRQKARIQGGAQR